MMYVLYLTRANFAGIMRLISKSYLFLLLLVAMPAFAVSLPNGGVVSGVIATAGGASYTLAVNTGETIRLSAASTGTNNSLSPSLYLYNAAGTEVARYLTLSATSAIEYVATTPGTYTVVVLDRNFSVAGTYNLYYAKAPGANEKGLLPSDGAGRNYAFNLGDIDSYTINANAGETIRLSVARTATSDTGFNPVIVLYDATGNRVETGSPAGVASAALTYVASTSGTYTVVVYDSYNNSTGNYNIYYVKAPGTNEANLSNGGTLSGVIDVGDMDAYSITVNTGETIRLSAARTGTNNSLLPSLYLYNAAGTEVARYQTGSATALIEYVATTPGTYTVVVLDRSFSVSGSYNLGYFKQSISFPAIADQALTTGSVSVSATATSGLPVSISSLTTTKCTVSGSTVTLKALGTCTLQANQSGDANYPSASPVNMSFNIVTATSGGGSTGGSSGDVPLPTWVLLLMTAALFGIILKSQKRLN